VVDLTMLGELPTSYQEINKQACPYPAFLLPEGGTGLCVFSAGFYGQNDVIHMARKKMTVTCVDKDAEKLFAMAQLYPQGWEFRVDDAWEFAERSVHDGRRFDAVSVDPFLGDAAERVWETLYLWTSLARNLLTITVKTDTQLNVPEGWELSGYFPRSHRAAWMVLTR